jgi:hypothetical protein
MDQQGMSRSAQPEQTPDGWTLPAELCYRGYWSALAHEEGHAWDAAKLSYAQHDRYMAIRGLPRLAVRTDTDWYQLLANENYADVFALLKPGFGEQTITPYIALAS